jgi:hypothetical protein
MTDVEYYRASAYALLAGRVWAGSPVRPVAGGKPSPGTPKDKRLSENKKGNKKPFPGAAPPFKGGGKKGS